MAIQNIDAKNLKLWLDNGEALLIDVREPEEFQASSIPGAINIPLNTLTWSAIPPHGTKKLVLHCGGGTRSSSGCEKLLAASSDPTIVLYNLEGGIKAWANANFPLNGGQTDALSFHSMPVQKQNHLILGGAILVSSLLALIFNSIWMIIPAAIGGVMLYEGLTDTNLIDDWIGKLPIRKK